MGILQVSASLTQCSSALPAFTGLQLPPVAAPTVPATAVDPGANAAAQSQFEALAQGASRGDIAPQVLEWFSATTGIAARREFRVVGGVLQENRATPGGTANWVDASTPNAERSEAGMQHLFLADGHLYRSDGTLVGRFGVNSSAVTTNATGEQFLRTFGTLHDQSGRLIDYSAGTLSLGGQPAIIQLGPPPGTVAIFRPSTRNVLVESNGGTAFREIGGDVAFERVWVPPAQAGTGTSITFTRQQVLNFPRQEDGSRYSPDGRLRFTFNSDGVLQTEVRIHLPTNWRDAQGLCMARVSWVMLPQPPAAPQTNPEQPLQPAPTVPPAVLPADPLPAVSPIPELPSAPGVALLRVSPTDAESFFQLFLATCRLSDLRADVGRGLQGIPAQVAGTPRLSDACALVAPNDISAAADAIRRAVFDFNLQLRDLPQQGMVAAMEALNTLLQGRIAGGEALPDALTPVMRVDVAQPPQIYCQHVGAALAVAHSESTTLFNQAIESLQLMQPAARNSLLAELRELTGRMLPGVQREQRLWQIELLEVELIRRAGGTPEPMLRPRPLPAS